MYILSLEKCFPLWGERAHSLKLFCMYDKRLRYKKQNRMEEEITIYPMKLGTESKISRYRE